MLAENRPRATFAIVAWSRAGERRPSLFVTNLYGAPTVLYRLTDTTPSNLFLVPCGLLVSALCANCCMPHVWPLERLVPPCGLPTGKSSERLWQPCAVQKYCPPVDRLLLSEHCSVWHCHITRSGEEDVESLGMFLSRSGIRKWARRSGQFPKDISCSGIHLLH